MILNGKAKEEFLKYYDTSTIKFLIDGKDFDDLPLYFQQSLLVNWFDSVGIYIVNLVRNVKNKHNFSYDIQFDINRIELCLEWFLSRQEATTEAIKKANEIFNSL